MRIVKLTTESKKNLLNDLLKRSPNNYTEYQDTVQEIVDNVRENLDEIIYDTLVPRNVRLAEAPSFGLPINMYDSRSSGAEAYRKLADEVIKNKLFQ